jgi:hypothetical protein
MAIDSSADLLFRISADSTPAQADLAALRGAVADTCSGMASDVGAAGDKAGESFTGMGEGAHKVSGQMRETREALRGLGEELGVTMPRFVNSWLASLGGVSTVMAAAFAPIAVIGLIEVLGKIPAALEKGIDWLHGWTAAVKKAFEESTKEALEFQERTIRLNERLRAIALIGEEGMKKWNLEAVVNSKNYKELADKIDELNAKLVKAREVAGIKPPGWIAGQGEAAREMAAILEGGERQGQSMAKVVSHSHEEVEKAKTTVQELEQAIKLLTAQLDDLTVKSKEIPAQAAAAARDTAAKWRESIEKQTAELATAAQHRIVEALKAQREEAAEIAKQREKIDEENEKLAAASEKRIVEGLKAQREEIAKLQAQLVADTEKTLEEKHRELNLKLDAEMANWSAETRGNQEAIDKMAALRKAGHAKIDADNAAAYEKEKARLDEQLKAIEKRDETSQERILTAYQADLAKFNANEDEETRKKELSEAERAAIAAKYAAIRVALYQKEQTDLQTLKNSQGWQGVFGDEFAQSIRRHEELSKEWATSAQRDHLAVQVSLESLKEMGQQAFQQMANGMGQAIANSIVYSKNMKQAMKEVAASTLESLSAQAFVKAIFWTAEGVADLAVQDYPDAALAFEAAALFGSVGAAAAVSGRAVEGKPSGATGAGAGAGASGGGGLKGADTGAGAGRTAAGQGGSHVTINVQGHIFGTSGMTEVASMLSDAVMNSDATLTATNTKTGVQVTK